MKYILLTSFSQSVEAHLARSILESEGIDVTIEDEHIVNMNWFYSNAVYGVKLKVRENEIEKAKKILEEKCKIEDNEEIKCPKCDSDDVENYKLPRRLFYLSIFLLGLPIPFIQKRWYCKNCKHKW